MSTAKPVSRVVPQRWRDFAPRLASAMVLAPLVLGAAWQGSWVWQALITLLATVALVEWASLCRVKLDGPLGLAAAASIPAAQAAYLATGLGWVPAVVLAIFAAAVNGWHRLLAGGVLYVGAGYVGLLLLREGAGGHANILFLLFVVWANDVGAYLAGRLIGGRRMAPKLSPGKTWAGAGGGLAFSVAAGLGVAMWLSADEAGQFRAEGIGAALSIVAQAGDLLESWLKRRSGKKDSGQLIPGHGGVLDRVDGLLAAAMLALLWQLAAHRVFAGPALWQ